MAKKIVKRIHLTFREDAVQEPLIHTVGKKFEIITNIRRANVSIDSGWVDLEIEGTEKEIEKALLFLEKKGVRVDPIEKNVIE